MKIGKITLDITIGALIAIGVFVILISTSKEISALVSWDKSMFGLGVGIIAFAIALISVKIARHSDKRMEAMTNLEFYEKIAVIESYIQCVAESYIPPNEDSKKAFANRIYNDIKGAKQLKKYVKPEIEQELNTKIQELIDIALKGQPYGNLVSRLQEVQKEDC